MSDTLPSVAQALASVMAALPSIGKDDRSPEGYNYRGIEQVTKHVQPLFAKHGVVVAPRAEITDVRPSPAMKDGWTDVFIRVQWTITGPDGSTIEAQTTGIGRDRADKGANKAQTQAFKYLLLHLLCIADGKDDSDGVSYEQDRHERAPEPPKANAGTHEQIRNIIGVLSDRQRAEFGGWFTDQGFPPIKTADRLSEAQASAVLDYLDALPADEDAA